MFRINATDAERIEALEARVASLEESNQALRTMLTRELGPSREGLVEKFRPKITRFHHYGPRKLKVPDTYNKASFEGESPTIAIVTPSYNQGRFIEATIESVLAQNYPALNYHVQDADSTDETVRILKSCSGAFSWSSTPDGGQAHGLNSGFRAVQGEIMAYLNSDDLLLPGTLAYVANAFAADPRLDVVYGHRICIDHSGMEIGRWLLPKHDSAAIKWVDYIPQETMFWRRRVWDTLGGFDESFQFAIDWDFILRAQAAGMKFSRLPRFMGCFRVHDAQKTTQMLDTGEEESRRLRKTYLGFIPDSKSINKAMKGYMRRHVIYHRLYKLKMLDF